MATADETLAAACESKIACLSNRDLLVVIAEALSQGAGGGGGGASAFHEATITLTNAQILALPSTPIVLVPATEVLGYVGMPATVPIVVQAIVQWKTYGGVVYGNVGGTSWLGLFLGSDAGANAQNMRISGLTFIGNAPPFFPMAVIGTGADQSDATFSGNIFTDGTNLLDSIEDNAISIGAVNAGNFTGGSPGDELIVTVLYKIFNTQTGAFS